MSNSKASLGNNEKDSLIPKPNCSVSAKRRKARLKRLKARRKIEELEESRLTDKLDGWA